MFDMFKSPGKIEVKTDKMSYSAGEKIIGKLTLAMDKAKDAKCVRLEFFAEKKSASD